MGNKPSTPPNDKKTRHEQLVEELHYHTTEDMIEYNKKTKKPYKAPKKDYKNFFNEFKNFSAKLTIRLSLINKYFTIDTIDDAQLRTWYGHSLDEVLESLSKELHKLILIREQHKQLIYVGNSNIKRLPLDPYTSKNQWLINHRGIFKEERYNRHKKKIIAKNKIHDLQCRMNIPECKPPRSKIIKIYICRPNLINHINLTTPNPDIYEANIQDKNLTKCDFEKIIELLPEISENQANSQTRNLRPRTAAYNTSWLTKSKTGDYHANSELPSDIKRKTNICNDPSPAAGKLTPRWAAAAAQTGGGNIPDPDYKYNSINLLRYLIKSYMHEGYNYNQSIVKAHKYLLVQMNTANHEHEQVLYKTTYKLYKKIMNKYKRTNNYRSSSEIHRKIKQYLLE